MDSIKALKEICSKIENNTSDTIGVCKNCVKIVIDYHDSSAGECNRCGEYYCDDCARYNINKAGHCECTDSKNTKVEQ